MFNLLILIILIFKSNVSFGYLNFTLLMKLETGPCLRLQSSDQFVYKSLISVRALTNFRLIRGKLLSY